MFFCLDKYFSKIQSQIISVYASNGKYQHSNVQIAATNAYRMSNRIAKMKRWNNNKKNKCKQMKWFVGYQKAYMGSVCFVFATFYLNKIEKKEREY